MTYKKEMIASAIYIGLNIGLYLTLDMKALGETFDIINMAGIGIFGAAMLIRMLEKFSNKLIDSGRLNGVQKLEETMFTKYTLFFGLSSIILFIAKNIIL